MGNAVITSRDMTATGQTIVVKSTADMTELIRTHQVGPASRRQLCLAQPSKNNEHLEEPMQEPMQSKVSDEHAETESATIAMRIDLKTKRKARALGSADDEAHRQIPTRGINYMPKKKLCRRDRTKGWRAKGFCMGNGDVTARIPAAFAGCSPRTKQTHTYKRQAWEDRPLKDKSPTKHKSTASECKQTPEQMQTHRKNPVVRSPVRPPTSGACPHGDGRSSACQYCVPDVRVSLIK